MKDRKSVYANFVRNLLDGEKYSIPISLQSVELAKYKIVRYVTSEEIHDLICKVWSKATLNEVNESLKLLESEKILRNSGNRWKVLAGRIIPTNVVSRNYRSNLKALNKLKPGVCSKCGVSVDYKNRHARSGTSHTGGDCALNRIRNVMEA